MDELEQNKKLAEQKLSGKELYEFQKRQKEDVPTNIGVGSQYSSNRFYDSTMSMTDIHIHDASGQLHWEVMQGPAKKDYLRLGRSFEIWDKLFNGNQFFDFTKWPERQSQNACKRQREHRV